MQPTTNAKISADEFDRMKKTVGRITKARRARVANHPGYATPFLEEIGIQLTYRCNLRCGHCFQWNDKGFFHHLNEKETPDELSADIFEKILFETREVKSNLYLWGGEPTLHRQWDDLAGMIEKDPRWTVICTNGLMIERKLESLLRISENLALLVSVDGFQEQHDAIRGKGTFDKVMKSVELICNLQQSGEYKGKISLSLVLSDDLVPNLYEFAEFCENIKGLDSLYFVYPWYITEEIANKTDAHYKKHFSWLGCLPLSRKASWHSYTFHINAERIEELRRQIDRLKKRTWDLRLRFQPALEPDEFKAFIVGAQQTGQRRSQCFSISTRMDVLADGTVSSCKLYPEFTVGNLYEEGVLDIWHGEKFNRVRETVVTEGLHPICSKCVLLYLHGN